MMADIVGGTSGDVTASGFNCEIDGWSGSLDVQSVSYRTFDSVWQKQKNIAYSMSGQFTGTIQQGAADTAPLPTETGGDVDTSSFEGVSFTLTAESGCTYTFTGNVTTVSVNRPATDRMTGTFNFESDGTVSQTWAES